MRATAREIETHLTTLRETPPLILDVAGQVDDHQARRRTAPDSWSLVELLAHIHACAQIWGDDIERMLANDEPVFAKPHPRQEMLSSRLLEPSFAASAQAFAALRRGLLEILQSLDPEQWERGATINGRRHTVYTQTRRMALHEAAHRSHFDETLREASGQPRN